MSDCRDFEERLGIKAGKIKLVIPNCDGYRDLKLTLEKRTRAGKNFLEVLIHGKSWRDERVYERITISWDAVESAIAWLSGGPRKPGPTRSSDDVLTLKRQMRDIRLAASLFKSGFKRLQTALDDAVLEAEIEKSNPFPEAPRRAPDFQETI